MQETNDPRPKTVVLHQFTGIGDLIWHIPYFRAVAEQSRDGRVSVIAQPSTLARQLIGHEPWVEEIIDHDHRPRRAERRQARHGGLRGMRRFAKELQARQFDRLVLFSGRPSRGLLAWMTGIPVRMGYGYHGLQRLFLNRGPYIERYSGPAVAAYFEASRFSVAHGFTDAPVVPRISVPRPLVDEMATRLRPLPRPLCVLAIGTSEPHKQWGAENFRRLAERLSTAGCGVVLLGGPGEAALAQDIVRAIDPVLRGRVLQITDVPLLSSAATLQLAQACIGNDTGMVNLAAACECPTYVLLGPRRPLQHDPGMRMLTAPTLDRVTVEQVHDTVLQDLGLTGRGADARMQNR